MRTVARTTLVLILAAGAPAVASHAAASAAAASVSQATPMQPSEQQPSAPAPQERSAGLSSAELERMVREVSSELRCVVCQGVSIQDSPSTLAQEMRSVVREQLAAGQSPEQVKAYFVERYGEWVLLRPKASGLNLLVYLLPIAVIAGGAAFIFMKARSWTRAAPETGSGAP